MSFVSVIAIENFITVVSDGLVVDLATGEETGQRYQKFRKISKNQFVAFGGNQGLGEKVVEVIGYHDDEKDLLPIANGIRDKLIEEISPKIGSCQVLLGGLENGSIVFYAFNNNQNQEMLIQKPKGDEVSYSFIASSKHNIDLDEEILRVLRKHGYTSPTKTIKVQKELNEIVAKKDPSVNNITFNLTIRK